MDVARLTDRGYTEADAAGATALFNVAESHAGGHPGWTVPEVRAMLASMVRDHDRDARVVVSPDGDMVAVAVVASPPEGGFRIDLMGAVRPDRRGRGIGRDLLGWQLRRAREIHRDTAPECDWVIHVATNAEDTDTLRLYRRAGLAPVRYWFDMEATADRPATVPVPDGLRVTEYRPGRDRDLHAAHTEAFADHWGSQARTYPDWESLTVRNESFAPALSRVAYDGDQIAGYVLAYLDDDPTRVYIGQVGVRRAWRRRGLAAAMLSQALRAAVPAGRHTLALSVDADSPTGAVGVYGRVGFTVQTRGVTYAIDLPAAPTTGSGQD
ncbi:GNAT family N-acetyltransferase [Rugosimonospora africana]|uniref:Putative acetyltransferase, GNAT n=1 Tax=Rugosimonospora africana TaxID=556532 RepID=A0A8J3VVG3_9ACTN|nr:GNAT family N-acetyltransferase [Rugosimonospora africana]GIH19751.1 putative acetyltransferase, GNAT [Rugosimonospora africana]